jgi:protein-tyrosine phosphatase
MEPRINDMIYSSSINVLDKNITSYNNSLKSKANFVEDSVRVNHLYFKENLVISNIEEYRYIKVSYDSQIFLNTNEYLSEEEKKKRYNNEEEEIFCGRFPHLSYCGCKFPCSITLSRISPIEITDQIFVGPIESAFKTKELLTLKITHILNVSCTEYNKRIKYFKFLDIYINDNHTENAIKFFKITNRFIDDAIKSEKKILIHSVQGRSRCWVFLMAYLIGKLKMKYVSAYDRVREKFPYAEPNDNFLTQLKHYDLEVNT